MSEKMYYERYWRKEFRSYTHGVAECPPEWEEKNLERIFAFCGDTLNGRVLDAGCGNGFFSFRLSQRSSIDEVLGIDISEVAIEKAGKTYPDISFKQGELCALPVEDNCFDRVTLIEVVEHLVDIEGVLQEVYRVLRPGGLALITTTDFNWLKQVLIAMFQFEKYFFPTNPHIRFFTRTTLAKVLSQSGLHVIKYAWNGDYFGIMPKGQMVLAEKRG